MNIRHSKNIRGVPSLIERVSLIQDKECLKGRGAFSMAQEKLVRYSQIGEMVDSLIKQNKNKKTIKLNTQSIYFK